MKLSALLSIVVMIGALLTATLASAQQAYRVRAGDILRIEVIEDNTLNRTVLVSPDGRITVPLAGSINAGGRSVEQIQSDLTAALAPSFASPPNVFVAIEQLRPREPQLPTLPEPDPTIDIYVLGEANGAGKIEVDPETTVLQLFAQMGGFSNFAATTRIQLRRTEADGSETVFVLNYDAIEAGQSPNGTSTLEDGDVLIVPQRRLFE